MNTKARTQLYIRASAQQKTLLSRAARLRRMNTSQFVLQASLDAADTVLIDRTTFTLASNTWGAFCERLDAPPRIIPELQALFRWPDPCDA